MRISDWSSDVCSSDLRASARKRAKGRLKAADEDGEDRIGVDAAQKPLERLGKAVIHVHRVGHGGVDSGSTDRLDRLDGKLPRHIEPSRRTSDVCARSPFNPPPPRRHPLPLAPPTMPPPHPPP